MEQVLLQPQTIKLSKDGPIKIPTTLKNKVLMSPGQWNGIRYTGEEIKRAYESTDWENKDITSIILDHADKPLSVHDWVGWIRNQRMEGDDLIGDLQIYDEGVLVKLLNAKMKCGISPRVKGIEHDEELRNFTFENFSIVTNPAVKEAYINLSDKGGIKMKEELDKIIKEMDAEELEELAKITGMEAERKRRGMSPSQFYAAPRDPPSASALPIFDAAHVRNALARFNQTNFRSPEEKSKAMGKIRSAAKKFGIKTELDDKGGIKMTDKELQDEAIVEGEEKKEEEAKPEAPVEETPEEEKKEETEEKAEEEKEEEMSDADLFEVTTNSAFPAFANKLKAKYPKITFKAMARAFNKTEKASEELEELSDEAIVDKIEQLTGILVRRKKYTEEPIKMTETEKKLSEELKEIKEKLDEPGAKSVQELSSTNMLGGGVFDEDDSAHYSPGVLGMANFIKQLK